MTAPDATGPSPLDDFLRALAKLPPAPGIAFRGWAHPLGLPAHTVVTRLITATSADLTVATAGWSAPALGIVVGRTGRDVTPFSALREAQEIVYAPGTMLRAHPGRVVAGLPARVYEELVVGDGQVRGMGIDPDEVYALVEGLAAEAAGAALPPAIDPGYCARFLDPLE